MEKIKSPSVAGLFYPDGKNELTKMIETFSSTRVFPEEFSTRAVIVPHAGLIYSGNLAYKGLNLLDENIKTLFIFAPAHRVYFEGISLTGFDFWETPLGKIEIDREIAAELKDKFGGKVNDSAFSEEHSIEVQIPLIQKLYKEAKIVPVLIGRQSADLIEKIISFYYEKREIGFVISSDLSHFLTDENAKRTDLKTAEIIESGNLSGFSHEMACGATGIAGLSLFAGKNKFSLIRVDMMNSSYLAGDKSRVVGYGAWALFEGRKNEFLKKYYSNFILDLCKASIKSAFLENEVQISYQKVFDESGASFVTLEKEGRLRGCIGSIIAHRSLISDLISNAKNAAFNDPRFNPVTENELDDLKIAVSLLSSPEPIHFEDEEDLLNKIIPFKDGIIISDKGFRSVYLPSVWEQLPDKREFLNSLKIKAGLPSDYFSKTFAAFKFETVYIK